MGVFHVLDARAEDLPALKESLGLALPRVSHHVVCTAHTAQELGLSHRQRTLLLGNEQTEASALYGLQDDALVHIAKQKTTSLSG